MPVDWLIENAESPIRHILTGDDSCHKNLLNNSEVNFWLSLLSLRSEKNEIGDVHGSHDYRMENILGKCALLGLNRNIVTVGGYLEFILNFIKNNAERADETDKLPLSFGKIYAYRDYETVLSCFLPMLGCGDDESVKNIARKRIEILYNFVKQKRYNIYLDNADVKNLKGVKKEWQPYVIDPALYADGNIALPTMHDFILFAGIYNNLTKDEQAKAEAVVEWVFDKRYLNISRRYGYFYAPGGSYNVKAVIFKMHLPEIKAPVTLEKSDEAALLFTCFILSHFQAAKSSSWFGAAMDYLSTFKSSDGRYLFPKHMIGEKTDSYVINGGHMNVGEDKKAKNYGEILSTYWMTRISLNL